MTAPIPSFPRCLMGFLLVASASCATAAEPTPPAGAPVATIAANAASATPAPDLAITRRAFVAAWDAARLRRDDSWRALSAGLASYPLAPYIEHAVLTRDLDPADAADVDAFLVREDGSFLADDLRTRWLTMLAARRQWPAFVAAWRPREATALKCAFIEARLATGQASAIAADARAVWLSGTSLPAACDAAIAWLARENQLTPALVWQRIVLAAQAREAKLIRSLAPRLPAAERAEAETWARTIAAPESELPKLAGTSERTRELARIALAQYARRNPDGAGALWAGLSSRVAFDDAGRAHAIGAIALWKAANQKPDAAQWMRQVPWDHADDGVREWRVREALSRGTLAEAAEALRTLSPTQQLDSRWRYLRARLLEIDGQVDAAHAAFTTLASEPNFHGFLAADRAGVGRYTLCGLTPSRDAATRARVAAMPGLVRAFELFAIDRKVEANREWDHTVSSLDAPTRALAADLAQQRGWLDRGPLTLLRADELRYYAQRFPLGHRDDVERGARRHALDPAFVFGIIRSESAWVVDARSSADARGLMQLLPSISPRLARLEHQPYANGNDLFRPPLNIALGTRHLREGLDRYDDRLWLAIAAYNAGPRPVDRWLSQRGQLPVDLWIETVPYKETREYLARVLAFSTIYDWRLHGDAASIASRLQLADTAGKAAPARVAVSCPQAAAPPAPAATTPATAPKPEPPTKTPGKIP